MFAAVISFQSCKVLSVSVINRRAVFWHLKSRQIQRSVKLDCILCHRYLKQHTPTDAAPCIVLTQGYFQSERPLTLLEQVQVKFWQRKC